MFTKNKSLNSTVRAASNFIIKKKIISILLSAALMGILIIPPAFARNVKVFINGIEVHYDVPSRIIANQPMLPLSQTLEALVGMGTVYDPASKTSNFHANGHTFEHAVGTNTVYIDGQPKNYDSESIIVDNRALVPLAMISDASGYTVTWDPADYFVRIYPKADTGTMPSGGTVPSGGTAPAATAAPQIGIPVAIISADTGKTSVSSGDSVIITVKTNAAANFVRINDGSKSEDAIYASMDSAGVKTWVLAYKPASTATLQIYASASQDMSGAVQKSLSVAVAPKIEITDVSANKTTIVSGESVSLTIKTSSSVGYVRIDYDNTNINASYSSIDNSGIKTWTATVTPTKSQNLSVVANATHASQGAVSRSIPITINNATVAIHSATLNKTSVYSGEQVELIIRTNSAANYVWVNINNSTVSARHVSTDYSGIKTWTATFSPYSSQQINILANSTQSTYGAVSNYTQYITVGSDNVSIISAYADPQPVTQGSTTTVTVHTTYAVNYVWVESYNQFMQLNHSHNDPSGYKVWTVQYTPTANDYLNVYAGRTNGSREASSSVSITTQTSQYDYPRILNVSGTPREVSYNTSQATNNNFYITTNSYVSQVYISYNGQTYYAGAPVLSGSGNYEWTISCNLTWDGSSYTSGYSTLTVTAISPTGVYATDQTALTIR